MDIKLQEIDGDSRSTMVSQVFEEAGGKLDLLLEGLSSIHEKSPQKTTALTMCGEGLYKRFGDEYNKEDLDKCIRAYDLAVESAGANLADYLWLLRSAATAYHARFGLTEIRSDIDRAIFLFDTLIKSIPDTHSEFSSILVHLGGSLHARFTSSKDHADLLWAVETTRQAVQLTPDDNLNLPSRLSNLTNLLQRLFEHEKDIVIISEAVELQQKAVQLTRNGDRLLPTWIEYLGDAHLLRFRHFGDPADIAQAVECYERLVGLVPATDIDFPLKLSSLGVALRFRFERFGDIEDISRAIKLQQQAIELAGEDPELPRMLDNLGTSLSWRFRRFGDIADISKAIELQRRAIEESEDDDPDIDVRLTNLGGLLQTRHERFGDLKDLEEAIEMQQKAINLHPNGHPDLYLWLHNLGTMFHARFSRFRGNAKDISQAIASEQRAVQLTPPGHPGLTGTLNNLGLSLKTRFERFGDVADISEAIRTLQQAKQLLPNDDPQLPARLSNLGISFTTRFYRNKSIADLTEAIRLHEKAVQLTPEDHPDHPLWLSNLGYCFHQLFTGSQDVADINKAVELCDKAVQLLPNGHDYLPAGLNHLGSILRDRFLHSGDISDISWAITSHRRSVELTPKAHPDLRGFVYNLGKSFHTRFDGSGDVADIQSALDSYRRATATTHGTPLHRLATARAWADACEHHVDDPSQVLEAYGIAIELISQVAGLEQTIELRHTNLIEIADLSRTAAAAAFTHQRPDLALEWLEQGRCLVWNQLNQLRTPLDNLRAERSDLADRLQQLSFALGQAGARHKSERLVHASESKDVLLKKVALEEEAAAHIRDADDWNQLLEQIRDIPEFHDFQRPRRASDILVNLRVSGPVIIINIHETRCDALALVPGHKELPHIPLPRFTHKEACYLRTRLVKYLSSAGKRMREAEPERGGHEVNPSWQAQSSSIMADLLRKLWLDVVKPIFDAIGYSTLKPTSNPGRFWWCSTGPLAFLPLHAAGIYKEGGPCISDFVISSYIPTVSTLIDKTDHKRQFTASNKVLLISQAEAKSLPRIPGADKEINMLVELINKAGLEAFRIAGVEATTDRVKKEMASYGSIHLACHAKQDVDKPLDSGFYLSDGPLLLSEVIKQQISGVGLAFLSACQTSMGDEQLSEEAVHLAGGMLAAGYRSVVATMWSINDFYGPETATTFYSSLLEKEDTDGNGQLNGKDAAYALHHAVQSLRRRVGDTHRGLLIWLPYIHFGV